MPAQPESCCLRQEEKLAMQRRCYCDWQGPTPPGMVLALFGEGRQSTRGEIAIMQNSNMKHCCGKLGVRANKAP